MASQDNQKIIITLGRQYGSNGSVIGRMLADTLDIPFYDKGLLALAASESGLNSQLLNLVDEQAMNIYMQASSAASAAARGDDSELEMSLNDQLYLAQADLIRHIAQQGSCVIVGRTANHILRDDPSLVTFFIHAPEEARVQNIIELNNVSREEARHMIASADSARAQYYRRHTGTPWAELTDFDLTVDSALLGVSETVAELARFACAVMAQRSGK